MSKKTLDTNTLNVIANIFNAGAKTEGHVTKVAGYTAAITKGASKGLKNGFLIGWNYDNAEARKQIIAANK